MQDSSGCSAGSLTAELPAIGLPATSLPAIGLPATSLPAIGLPATSLPATSLPASLPVIGPPSTEIREAKPLNSELQNSEMSFSETRSSATRSSETWTSGAMSAEVAVHEAQNTKVCAIILNWNQPQLSLACLESMERQVLLPGQMLDCLIVDNGSRDQSRQVFEAALEHRSTIGPPSEDVRSTSTPKVSLLLLAENRGFAGGMNAGIRHALDAGYEHLLILNNDTLADRNLLRELLAAMRVPQVGLLAPTIHRLQALDANREQDLSIDLPHYDREGNLSDRAPIWPSAGWRKESTLDALDTTAQPPRQLPYSIDWMTGCCMLMRADLATSIGLFDEGFHMYYEDHDLCLRAKAAGWDLLHVPSARLGHRVAASSGANSPEQRYMMARSSVRYYWKHSSGAQRLLLLATRGANLMLTLLRTLPRGDWRGGFAYTAGIRQGFRDLRSAAGRAADDEDRSSIQTRLDPQEGKASEPKR